MGQAVTGAAQPQVTIDNLSAVPCLVPPERIVREYSGEGMIRFADHLILGNRELVKMRDMLLPQLMAGRLL